MQRVEQIQMNLQEFRQAEQEAYVKGAFGLGTLQSLAIGFVVIAVVISFGVVLLDELKTKINVTANPDAGAVIDNGITGLKSISDYLGLVALVVVIGVILGVIFYYLGNRE